MKNARKNTNLQGKQTNYLFRILSYLILLLLVTVVKSKILRLISTNPRKIVIIGTNDFHGSALATKLIRSSNDEEYQYGGLVYLARLIQIFRQQYSDNLLYLDAGDQFQGGIESSPFVSEGQIINDFYKVAGLNGSAIGNHQFDFGPQFLNNFLQNRDLPNLAANLRSQNGQQNFLPKQQKSHIYNFSNGIRIGVIGLSTIKTPYTTNAFISDSFPQYQFLNYKEIVISESQELRKKGVHAVLILSHAGIHCSNQSTLYGIWTEDNQKSECVSSQVIDIIDSLPEGTIDGVIQGHQHHIVHKFHKGIPISGAINGGFYFNALHLTFDDNNKIIKKQIEGPIPVCGKVFENAKTCNYLSEKQQKEAGNLTNWKFHGENVYADSKLNKIFEQKWQAKMEDYNKFVVKNEVYLTRETQKQSQLGNLITELVHKQYPYADFVILNNGGFRTSWYPSKLLYKNVYNMFPFKADFYEFQINGKELKKMIETAEQGDFGHYPTYGLRQKVQLLDQDTFKRKLVSVQFSNGNQIQDDNNYIGVSNEFLISGGDDFKKIINVSYFPRKLKKLGQVRTVINDQLRKLKTIKRNTLIDHQNSNYIFV